MSELTYTMQGDYNLPDLTMPEQPEVSLGRYAQMRRKYLKENHRVLYYNLLTKCKMTEHLHETEQRALEMEETLLKQMSQAEGLTESLKATDMMSWVQRMNNLRNRVQEIVMAEVIFA
ncbi:MAG TPA: TnpV protein [Clostridiales bacterium]|nr:TnpV protein [Clostridiales bacterium]